MTLLEQPAPLERALVRRARAGDPQAFRTVFDRYVVRVRRFLRDLLREDAAADEATQETFVRAHRLLSGLRDEDRLASWLLGIARNVAMEQLRARRKARAGDDEATSELPDLSPSPEALLLGRESDRVLGEALAELDEERRAALLLRIDHGLGYDDIAGRLGWPLAKVKNEIHRARLELRAHLGKYLAEARGPTKGGASRGGSLPDPGGKA